MKHNKDKMSMGAPRTKQISSQTTEDNGDIHAEFAILTKFFSHHPLIYPRRLIHISSWQLEKILTIVL
jgi:hypothetical protein